MRTHKLRDREREREREHQAVRWGKRRMKREEKRGEEKRGLGVFEFGEWTAGLAGRQAH